MARKYLPATARVLLGAVMLLTGLNKIFWFAPMPHMSPALTAFMGALKETGYFPFHWDRGSDRRRAPFGKSIRASRDYYTCAGTCEHPRCPHIPGCSRISPCFDPYSAGRVLGLGLSGCLPPRVCSLKSSDSFFYDGGCANQPRLFLHSICRRRPSPGDASRFRTATAAFGVQEHGPRAV